MTPTELIESLPEDLKQAFTMMAMDREMAQDVGFPELRAVFANVMAGAFLNPETLRIAEERLETWIDEQRALHEQARDVFIKIYELEPPDIEGAAIPAWYLTRWARTLRDPWSENLASAVVSALDHLERLHDRT